MFCRKNQSRLVALERDVRGALTHQNFGRFVEIHHNAKGPELMHLCELNKDLQAIAVFHELSTFLDELDSFLQTQFERAVRLRDVKLVRALLECGADVSINDDWATSFAIVHGHFGLLTLLLEAGGRLDLPSKTTRLKSTRPNRAQSSPLPPLLPFTIGPTHAVAAAASDDMVSRSSLPSSSSSAQLRTSPRAPVSAASTFLRKTKSRAEQDLLSSREYAAMPQCYNMRAHLVRENGQQSGKIISLALPDIIWAAEFGGILVVEQLASLGAQLPRKRPHLMPSGTLCSAQDGTLLSVCVFVRFLRFGGVESNDAFEIIYHTAPYSSAVTEAFLRGWKKFVERRTFLRETLLSQKFFLAIPPELVNLLMEFV